VSFVDLFTLCPFHVTIPIMKKIIAVLLFVMVATTSFGQTSLLNIKKYEAYFGTNQKDISRQYVDVASDDDYERFSVLGGNLTDIDTPLEFALLSYYSDPVKNIRPPEADKILPANNPRLAGLKLGAAVYQELQIIRFLADTQAIGRYEEMLRFISSKSNATRAEIEAYYRDGIRSFVSDIVDENIAKSRFGAPTATALAEIKTIITQFFLNPTRENFNVLYQRLYYHANTDGNRGKAAMDVLYYSVQSFSITLSDSLVDGSF